MNEIRRKKDVGFISPRVPVRDAMQFRSLETVWQETADRIRAVVSPSRVMQKGLPVFYPGAGVDIHVPLAYTDASKFVFIDYIYIDKSGQLQTDWTLESSIERTGGVVRNTRQEGILGEGGKRVITFDYNGKERMVTQYAEDATTFVPDELKDGIGMSIIVRPTASPRSPGEAPPGKIWSEEFLGKLYDRTEPGGFIHWNPTEVLDSRIVGFKQILPPFAIPGQGGTVDTTDPLYQKVQSTPNITSLLELDTQIPQVRGMLDGGVLFQITPDTLDSFAASLMDLRKNFIQQDPKIHSQLLRALKANLIPNMRFLTENHIQRFIALGRDAGIVDEESVKKYLEQAGGRVKKVFPELR